MAPNPDLIEKNTMNNTLLQLGQTPINVNVLCSLLVNYPDKVVAEKLPIGFRNGFPLHYVSEYVQTESNNRRSVAGLSDIVQGKRDQKKVAVPFLSPPFKQMSLGFFWFFIDALNTF